MQLPGGLMEDGIRRRDCAFRPISGTLELALAEAGETAANTPGAVTLALAAALEHLGGEPATPQRVARLCVADRQFLMRELERCLGQTGGWFQVACSACAAHFDFHLDYAELPVQEAGTSYPIAQVEVAGQAVAFRLPNGADQEILAALPVTEARRWLLRQLAQTPATIDALDADAISAIEAGLEAVSPGVIVQVRANCPDCGTENHVDLNPYRALSRGSDELLQEVHQIAGHYHWDEAEILALPRARRQRYLRLIDRARGMAD
ncbi:MAG: hypothetical protein HY850_03565 [Betaproteobacteria bacterium]|nr:hypothetical protein [Betaproteobacteria bacterium]